MPKRTPRERETVLRPGEDGLVFFVFFRVSNKSQPIPLMELFLKFPNVNTRDCMWTFLTPHITKIYGAIFKVVFPQRDDAWFAFIYAFIKTYTHTHTHTHTPLAYHFWQGSSFASQCDITPYWLYPTHGDFKSSKQPLINISWGNEKQTMWRHILTKPSTWEPARGRARWFCISEVYTRNSRIYALKHTR